MHRKKPLERTLRSSVGILCMLLGCAAVSNAQETRYGWTGHQQLYLPEISLAAKPLARASLGDSAAGEPQRPTRYDWSDRRWGVEAAVTFVRFQSSIFYASMVGFKTSLSYNLNDWVEAEGGVTTGFAPRIFQNEHVKYLDYMVGVRLGPHRDTISPWAHVLVGGAHLLPQTADNSKNSFAMKAGIGADYRLSSVLSVRVEADWLRTQFFNDTQNNFQASTGIVVHF
jgi:Outer membrane protein beta-barrel domain